MTTQNNEVKAIPKGAGWMLAAAITAGLFWYGVNKPVKVSVIDSVNITSTYARYESCVTRGIVTRNDESDLSDLVNRLSVYNPLVNEYQSIRKDYLTNIIAQDSYDIDLVLKDGVITQDNLIEDCRVTVESAKYFKNNYR